MDSYHDVSSVVYHGMTIATACQQGNLPVCVLLWGVGAAKNVNLMNPDRYGNSPFHYAALSDNTEIFGFLKQQAEMMELSHSDFINSKNANGETPFLKAAGVGNINIIEELVNDGADVFVRDNNGINACMILCKAGYLWCLNYLCEHIMCNYGDAKLDAFLTAVDKEQHNPLDFASAFGNINIMEYLLRKGCAIHRKDRENRTALFWAVNGNQYDAVRFLILCGALPYTTDYRGVTPFQLAKNQGNVELCTLITDLVPVQTTIEETETADDERCGNVCVSKSGSVRSSDVNLESDVRSPGSNGLRARFDSGLNCVPTSTPGNDGTGAGANNNGPIVIASGAAPGTLEEIQQRIMHGQAMKFQKVLQSRQDNNSESSQRQLLDLFDPAIVTFTDSAIANPKSAFRSRAIRRLGDNRMFYILGYSMYVSVLIWAGMGMRALVYLFLLSCLFFFHRNLSTAFPELPPTSSLTSGYKQPRSRCCGKYHNHFHHVGGGFSGLFIDERYLAKSDGSPSQTTPGDLYSSDDNLSGDYSKNKKAFARLHMRWLALSNQVVGFLKGRRNGGVNLWGWDMNVLFPRVKDMLENCALAPEKYIGLFLGCMLGILYYLVLNVMHYLYPLRLSTIGGVFIMDETPVLFMFVCGMYLCTLYWYWVVVFVASPGAVDTRNTDFPKIMEVHASQWRKGPSVHPIVESQPDASKNMVEYCKTTLVYKPLRSKYCVQMGFVVARFDHYCFWLHTTVGYENHRQFIGLLLSLTVLLICLMVAMIRTLNFEFFVSGSAKVDPCGCMFLVLLSPRYSYIVFFVCVQFVVVVGLVSLIYEQFRNIIFNVTTNELFNSVRYEWMQDGRGGAFNRFDRGPFANIMEFFRISPFQLDYFTAFQLPRLLPSQAATQANVENV